MADTHFTSSPTTRANRDCPHHRTHLSAPSPSCRFRVWACTLRRRVPGCYPLHKQTSMHPSGHTWSPRPGVLVWHQRCRPATLSTHCPRQAAVPLPHAIDAIDSHRCCRTSQRLLSVTCVGARPALYALGNARDSDVKAQHRPKKHTLVGRCVQPAVSKSA